MVGTYFCLASSAQADSCCLCVSAAHSFVLRNGFPSSLPFPLGWCVLSVLSGYLRQKEVWPLELTRFTFYGCLTDSRSGPKFRNFGEGL